MILKLKVLFILPSLNAGGTENYVLRFVRRYKGNLDCTVLSVSRQRGDLEAAYLKEGVRIRYQSIGYLNPLKWFRFYKYLKRERFYAVCAMNGAFGGVPSWIAYLANVSPRIVFYRRSSIAFSSGILRLLYFRLINGLVYRFSTHVLSNSKHAFDVFFSKKQRPDSRFKVIPNGVDTDLVEVSGSKDFFRKKFGIPGMAFVIGHVGRFDKAKNHSTILSVAKRIIAKYNHVYFVFCGKDTNSAMFVEEIKNRGLDSRCITLGLQEHIGEVLRTFDLFYFPSVTEGQPNSLIEAMIAEVPVLTSNIKPIVEIYPPQFAYQLIDPLDIDETEKRLSSLIESDEVRLQYIHRDWVKEKFEGSGNFELFYREIVAEDQSLTK
jgi:glycosyltransferase involved in cell wall biosynthesis